MKTGRQYPSKIMLVGEYGVVAGGSALTIPFFKFKAEVRSTRNIPVGKEEEAAKSLKYIRELHQYIKQLPVNSFHASPDLGQFASAINDYWLELDIPVGYGLGSSGAVSAAIYDLFFPQSGTLSFEHQKEDLASIESYFHGKSSGVDALTCHAVSTLQFLGDGTIKKVHFDPVKIPGGYRFFLLNSHERFDTGPLVRHFLREMENPEFKKSIINEYLPINQKLIETLLGERDADPALLVRTLSDYQFHHFRKMIPKKMIDVWIEGQVTNEYYFKLNGSGGGFMLGITHESSIENLKDRWKDDLIWIE